MISRVKNWLQCLPPELVRRRERVVSVPSRPDHYNCPADSCITTLRTQTAAEMTKCALKVLLMKCSIMKEASQTWKEMSTSETTSVQSLASIIFCSRLCNPGNEGLLSKVFTVLWKICQNLSLFAYAKSWWSPNHTGRLSMESQYGGSNSTHCWGKANGEVSQQLLSIFKFNNSTMKYLS